VYTIIIHVGQLVDPKIVEQACQKGTDKEARRAVRLSLASINNPAAKRDEIQLAVIKENDHNDHDEKKYSVNDDHLSVSEPELPMCPVSPRVIPPAPKKKPNKHIMALAKYLFSEKGQITIAWLVVINVLFIMVEFAPEAVDLLGRDFLTTLDVFFTVLFLLEIVVKSIGAGCRYIVADWWTFIDTLIILLSSVQTVLQFVLPGGIRIYHGLVILRVFKVVRVGRVGRLLHAQATKESEETHLAWRPSHVILFPELEETCEDI